jgi:hypothetical protein
MAERSGRKRSLDTVRREGHVTEALAGQGKEGIGHGSRHHRIADLAKAAWRRVTVDELDVELLRRIRDTEHIIVMEIRLLDDAALTVTRSLSTLDRPWIMPLSILAFAAPD